MDYLGSRLRPDVYIRGPEARRHSIESCNDLR